MIHRAMAPWPPEGGRVKDPHNQLWILPSVKNITSMQLECVAKLNQEGPRLTLDWILHSEKLYGETCSFSHAKMCYTELYRVDTASLFSLLLYLICPSPSCSSLSPHLTKSAMSYLVLEDIHSFHYFLRQPENSFISHPSHGIIIIANAHEVGPSFCPQVPYISLSFAKKGKNYILKMIFLRTLPADFLDN